MYFRPSHLCRTQPHRNHYFVALLKWHCDPSTVLALCTFDYLRDTNISHADFQRSQNSCHPHWNTPNILWHWLCSRRFLDFVANQTHWQSYRAVNQPTPNICHLVKMWCSWSHICDLKIQQSQFHQHYCCCCCCCYSVHPNFHCWPLPPTPH